MSDTEFHAGHIWLEPFKQAVNVKCVSAGLIESAFLKSQAGFHFNDGTTQGWTLDQLYDVKTLKQLIPADVPAPGFLLSNGPNLTLEAGIGLLVCTDFNVQSCQFAFESPNLKNSPDWQDISGYRVSLKRTFTSPAGEPPNVFHVQFQARVEYLSDGNEHIICQKDPATGNFAFNVVKLMTPYHFTWTFKPMPDIPPFKMLKVRILVTMPTYTGPGMAEYLPSGSWLIGHVCPEK